MNSFGGFGACSGIFAKAASVGANTVKFALVLFNKSTSSESSAMRAASLVVYFELAINS